MRYFILILSFVFLIGIAKGEDRVSAGQGSGLSIQSKVSSVDESVPVPVPEPSAKAVQLHQSGIVFWLIRTVWGMVLPVALLFGGFSARLRDFARRIGRHWYWMICVYFVILMLLNYGLNWPLRYYLGFVRPHAYGLSNQTFIKWFGDSLKNLGVTLVGGCLFLWIPYLLLKKSPRRWWLYGWLAMLPVFFLVVLVEPLVVAPLFNKFGPVKDKALEAKIVALAEKAGIHGSRVYEVNKSVDTKMSNAYVSGFMGTKRIVLWDTIIAQLNERELLFVMGHEMGHYALGHVVKGILCSWILTLVAFYGIHVTAGVLIRRFAGRFGFDSLSDIASLPLIILLVSLFSLVLTPIGFTYSRHMEHEADRFGLELTHYNHSGATGFVKMERENLGYPRPGVLYTIWLGTHPSAGDRIDFFNDYKPWEKGEPSKYERYFGRER
jgi:STE24 endopeptidase